MLMLYAGLRDAEAEEIRWSDYDKRARVLHVRKGKGNKARVVPVMSELGVILGNIAKAIGPSAKMACLPSIAIARPTPGRSIRRYELFTDLLSDAGVQHERDVCEISRLPRRITKHSLRHTYCAALLATGESGGSLRLNMGHGSENLTTHYGKQTAAFKAIVTDENWPRIDLRFMRGGDQDMQVQTHATAN